MTTRFKSIVRNKGINGLLPAVFVAALCIVGIGRTHAAEPSQGGAYELTKVASMAPDRKPAGVPDDYVITPNGYFSPSCVVNLHAGDTLKTHGLIQRASGVTEQAPACGKPSFTAQGLRVEPNGQRPLSAKAGTRPVQNGWVEDASYTTSVPTRRIVASWTVPAGPAAQAGQTIYYFPGLEQLPTVQSILQPVMAWNGYNDNAWKVSSWNCCVDGTTFHSDPISASPGDQIVGDTYSTCPAGQKSCATWKIDSRNTTTGQTSSLTTNPYADLTWVFGGVLEVYNVSSCNQYPGGPLTFRNIQVYDWHGNLVSNTPWSNDYDTSTVNPQCNYGVSRAGTSVTVSY